MTEAEWLTSTDPAAMLEWLCTPDTNWFPDRKMRKFVGDQFVSLVNDRKLRSWCEAAWVLDLEASATYGHFLDGLDSDELAEQAQHRAEILEVRGKGGMGAHFLRCVIGNPWRPMQIRENVPRWVMNSTALALAQSIYDRRDFAALPILADALEDAGCDNADIIGHLRGPGPHARGCHVLDLLLDKE